MQKIFIAKIFSGPPSDHKKIQSPPPPFLPWKLWVNPREKHVNSIFNGKSVIITRVKNFKGPPFCIRPPPYKCLWTVPYSTSWKRRVISNWITAPKNRRKNKSPRFIGRGDSDTSSGSSDKWLDSGSMPKQGTCMRGTDTALAKTSAI